MPSFTLGTDQRFHVGDTIYCYRGGGGLTPVSPEPVTSAAVAADGTTTLSDLAYASRYLAGEGVNGPFVAFTTEPEPGMVGSGELDGETVDTDSHFRLIMFSNGTVKAIPFETPTPTIPTGLAAAAKLSSVRVSWAAATAGGASYAVYRGGVQVAQTSSLSYRDLDIAVGQTYSYAVQTIDSYGQRSEVTSSVTAFVDPSTNHDPTVTVHAWPVTLPSAGRGILRVNAADVDAQTLALALEVDAGSIASTDDPSIWIYIP